jgi:GGDEF domain-containing protein
MVWYVAFIAGLNLSLGYLWAVYFRQCPRCARRRAADAAWDADPIREVVEPLRPVAAPKLAPQRAPEASIAVPEKTPAKIEAPLSRNATVEPPSSIEPAMPLDPATGLMTREHIEWLLDQMSTNSSPKGPITIGLMEIDAPEWNGAEPLTTIDERLLCGISNIVRQTLGDEQTAARYTDQQILLLVPDENVEQAMRRAEEIRQRVATTEFTAEGRMFQTTLTCALTEVTQERHGAKLFEFLKEALDEAKRYGGNRTFMHDGNSPSPVVPPELELGSQQLAI